MLLSMLSCGSIVRVEDGDDDEYGSIIKIEDGDDDNRDEYYQTKILVLVKLNH